MRVPRVYRDATARDFSINSLLWDPCSHTLLDYNGGVVDLHNGRVAAACMPIKSLVDDPSRCIRCCSFAVLFFFTYSFWRARAGDEGRRRVRRMLRFASAYGFAIERPLWRTAARLTQARLLSPPSNLARSGHRKPPEDTLVVLDAGRMPEAGAGDPRQPRPRFAGHLDPDLLSINCSNTVARAEVLIDSFPGAVATCVPLSLPRHRALLKQSESGSHTCVCARAGPAYLMTSEWSKAAQSDRARPGAFADFIALAISTGNVEATVRVDPVRANTSTWVRRSGARKREVQAHMQAYRNIELPSGCALPGKDICESSLRADTLNAPLTDTPTRSSKICAASVSRNTKLRYAARTARADGERFVQVERRGSAPAAHAVHHALGPQARHSPPWPHARWRRRRAAAPLGHPRAAELAPPLQNVLPLPCLPQHAALARVPGAALSPPVRACHYAVRSCSASVRPVRRPTTLCPGWTAARRRTPRCAPPCKT